MLKPDAPPAWAEKLPAPLGGEFALVASPQHPQMQELLAYWQSRLGGMAMPRDLPHRAIARLLRHIAIHEPVAEGCDLLVRAAYAADLFDFDGDPKGRRMSEMLSALDFGINQQISMQAVTSGLPVFGDARVFRDGVLQVHMEIGWLPLRAPDGVATWLLNCVFHFA